MSNLLNKVYQYAKNWLLKWLIIEIILQPIIESQQLIRHELQTQSAEHLDVPTNRWTTNQNQSVNDPPTNQPGKIAAHQTFIHKYEYLRFYYQNWMVSYQ